MPATFHRLARFRSLLPWLLLCLSVAAAVYLYQRGERLKAAWYFARVFPLGSEYRPDQPVMPAGAIMVLGDSRAEEWPRPPGLEPRVSWFNAGVGGQTSTQVMLRHHCMTGPGPSVLVVQVGINDLACLSVLRERRREILDAAERNLRQIVSDAKSRGARVVLCTVHGRAAGGWTQNPRGAAIDEALPALNAMITRFRDHGVEVFDTQELLGADARVRPEFCRDEFHLNATGYARLNEAILSVLASEGRAP